MPHLPPGVYWASNGAEARLRVAVVKGGNPRQAAAAFAKLFPEEGELVLVTFEADGEVHTARFMRTRDNLGG